MPHEIAAMLLNRANEHKLAIWHYISCANNRNLSFCHWRLGACSPKPQFSALILNREYVGV
jgi:hypothetical protein